MCFDISTCLYNPVFDYSWICSFSGGITFLFEYVLDSDSSVNFNLLILTTLVKVMSFKMAAARSCNLCHHAN